MKPTVSEVLALVHAYYAKPENNLGGHLHLVLDDLNVDAQSVQLCRDEAAKAGDHDGVRLADLLLQMSTTQRRELVRSNDRFLTTLKTYTKL